jgi:hypothetical protein
VSSQQQKGGSGSTNIQIGTLSTGLTYSDVRTIAAEIFEQNFAHLSMAAKETANQRAEEMREDVLSELQKGSSDPSSFSQVEKQVALLEAQKAYALSGDDELKEMLVRAVVEVSKSPERSKKSIVMSEAIKVAPLLTPEQLRTLGLVFSVAQVNFKAASLEDLFSQYAITINLAKARLGVTVGDLRHLEYAGCGSVGLTGIIWDKLFRTDYTGLIQRGFSKEVADERLIGVVPPPPVRRSVRTPGLLEFAFHRIADIDNVVPWSTSQKELVKNFMNEHLMTEDEIRSEIMEVGGDASYLFGQWTELHLSQFKLTSVGIAVGYTFIAQHTPLSDIEIWL